MHWSEKINTKIKGIHIEQLPVAEPFIDLASRFSSIPGTVILMSGGETDCARHHIMAADPWLTFKGQGKSMAITCNDETFSFNADPFDTLKEIVTAFKLKHLKLPEPVSAGVFGYLSYDLKDHIEKLPRTSIDDLYLPQIFFAVPSFTVVHDKQSDKTLLCVPERIVNGKNYLQQDMDGFKKMLSATTASGCFSGGKTGFKSNFNKTDYKTAVKTIIDYIAAGDVYQVNMSQRFEMDFTGNPFSLFKVLYDNNPAPFFAYINAGDHHIVSTSPERFIKQTGNTVETRPIKGTRPRGKTHEEDKRLRQQLEQSRKDDAELSMIVDLLRNDIGKVCKAGSVRVAEHKRIETYKNVYHLVSIVEGELAENKDFVDLIRATFPGGSITGCPKIRSMEIIDELEPHRRHIYTGSIGYISFHDTMDLSIAIRTATVYNNKIIFSVGGGIVFDSNPEDEFNETLHKGKTLMDAFKGKEDHSKNRPHIWINGSLKPAEDATIPVTDQGLQYGFGFFETIRVDHGQPKFLAEHMKRFNRAWEKLFSSTHPDLTWKDVIHQVINKNNLLDKTAAVKIMTTKGDRDIPPYNHSLIVTAQPYMHRLAVKHKSGLDLLIYPESRQTPLADHKTLNYLYYFLAGKWAVDKGADEALILNPDGSVSESNTGNILFIRDNKVIKPVSLHVLPGIMETAVLNFLSESGFRIETKKIMPEDIFLMDQVVVTNSLMGAVPVLGVDGKKTRAPTGLCDTINTTVL